MGLEEIRDHGDIPANLVDLQEHLGGIPFDRISMMPSPGTATEEDLVRWKACELVDGVIVVKATNIYKSLLNGKLLSALSGWENDSRVPGYVFPSVAYRFRQNVIRLPDISWVSIETWGNRRLKDVVIADFAPDLAIDFFTPQNTQREMQRKRQEYLEAGVKEIWTVDTIERGVWRIRSAAGDVETDWLGKEASLEAPHILPGFRLSINDWFAKIDEMFSKKT